jgi:putative transposase
MSTKRTKYSANYKSKLVLEVLKNEKTLSEIASENNITPKNLQNWKKIFLENAEIAMEPSKAVKEYKEELSAAQEQNEMLTKIVGKMTVEKEWLEKKLKSLDSSDKKVMIEPKLETLSLSQQCVLLGLNRTSHYYKPSENLDSKKIKTRIVEIFEEIPIYGAAKVHQQLQEDGFKVSLNTVSRYRQQLGLKAVLAVKQINTTVPIKEHKKYSYKLRELDIAYANQVWSTDITYVKINGGMVYLAAIIDWHSKAVLSHKISNTMDSALVMDVLEQALRLYGTPEIFNTDQGSQYTSEIHTQRLKNKGIIISMDGKGRATDNICIERFWRSAKCERIYLNEYDSISALQKDVDDYIDFYNHRRFHETLDYKKPMNVYQESCLLNNRQNEAA